MNWQVIALILVSVTLSTVAQLLLKTGMSSPAVQAALASGPAGLLAALLNPWVLGGLGLYGLGALLWLLVLARADLSYAYPFVGLGFVLTLLFSVLVLGEVASLPRVLGTALVVAGVVLISRTA